MIGNIAGRGNSDKRKRCEHDPVIRILTSFSPKLTLGIRRTDASKGGVSLFFQFSRPNSLCIPSGCNNQDDQLAGGPKRF